MFTEDGKLILSIKEYIKERDAVEFSGLYCSCGEPLIKMGSIAKMMSGITKELICRNCDLKPGEKILKE